MLYKRIILVSKTTEMTQFEMSTTQNLIPNLIFSIINKNKFLIFQVGDFVKDPDKRNIYSKC